MSLHHTIQRPYTAQELRDRIASNDYSAELLLQHAMLLLDAPAGTEARVCADIAARQHLGIAKYGTTVESNPLTLREWLKHAYEECLDQAVYLRRAMEQIDQEADDGR